MAHPVCPKYAKTSVIAQMYGLSPVYLRGLRYKQEGPPYVQRGRLLLYPLDEFDEWFRQTMRRVVPES